MNSKGRRATLYLLNYCISKYPHAGTRCYTPISGEQTLISDFDFCYKHQEDHVSNRVQKSQKAPTSRNILCTRKRTCTYVGRYNPINVYSLGIGVYSLLLCYSAFGVNKPAHACKKPQLLTTLYPRSEGRLFACFQTVTIFFFSVLFCNLVIKRSTIWIRDLPMWTITKRNSNGRLGNSACP